MNEYSRKIINIGSINWDDVWTVPGIARPGETISATSRTRFFGGKGLNQSVAAARAGATVIHIGQVGLDARPILDFMESEGIDTSLIRIHPDEPTGLALIQVDAQGENAIIIHKGANGLLSPPSEQWLAGLDLPESCCALLQNETPHVGEWIQFLAGKGFRIIWNPAPVPSTFGDETLRLVHTLVVNHLEASGMTGIPAPVEAAYHLASEFRIPNVILTQGPEDVVHLQWDQDSVSKTNFPVPETKAVDTTAAGDTFTGYYAASLAKGMEIQPAIRTAIQAAAISITRPGAAASIPRLSELNSSAHQ